MPIVMDLGFGEAGDAGDRGTVNRQATRGHEIYLGSGPRRENPTPACLLFDYGGTEGYRVHRFDLAWMRVRKYELREFSLGRISVCRSMPSSLAPPSLYIWGG